MKWMVIAMSLMSCQPAFKMGKYTSADVFKDKAVRALADAACAADIKAIDAAIKAGASPNAPGVEHVTPLWWAAECENVAGLKALIARGGDPNLAAEDVYLVNVMANYAKPDILKALLEAGANPNSVSKTPDPTPLGAALSASMSFPENKMENLRLLLEAGANVNYKLDGMGGNVVERAADLNRAAEALLMLDYNYTGELKNLRWSAHHHLDSPSTIAEVRPALRQLLARLDEIEAERKAAKPK